jgi:hypothetical protein
METGGPYDRGTILVPELNQTSEPFADYLRRISFENNKEITKVYKEARDTLVDTAKGGYIKTSLNSLMHHDLRDDYHIKSMLISLLRKDGFYINPEKENEYWVDVSW